MESDTRWLVRSGLVIGLTVWLLVALISATQQWAMLRETPKHAGWLAAFLYQAPSWMLLVVLTPIVGFCVWRYPIEGEGRWRRVIAHLVTSCVFGAVFLSVSFPIRRLFHPAPLSWDVFGAPFYKSGPQFLAIGMMTYWLIVLIASLAETRARLTGLLLSSDEGVASSRIVVRTLAGESVLESKEVRYAEPAQGGSLLHCDRGVIRTRHGLGELEEILGGAGIARVHRSRLVNLDRVVEMLGSAHREGLLRLDSGEEVPVSRRRQAEVSRLLRR